MKLYFIGYRGEGFVSKGIKFVTRGQYSHVGQIVSEKPKPNNYSLKELSAYEGIGKVGYTNPKSHKNGTSYDVFSVEVSMRQYKDFHVAKVSKIGEKYDYLGILGFLFNNYKFNRKNKWFCSELETHCCRVAKIPLFNWDQKKEELTSPTAFLCSPVFVFEFSGVS